MVQHINLYAATRKPKGASVSVRGVIAMTAAFAAGFVLLAWIEARRIESLRDRVARDQVEVDRLTRLLKQLPNDSATNAEKISTEEREVVALETIAARLSAGVLGQAGSFTDTLKGFGRATTDGVWLTGIRLAQGQSRMAFEGKAVDAARVPALIEALAKQPQFAGTAFATIEIKRDDGRSDGDAAIRFRITSLDPSVASRGAASLPSHTTPAAGANPSSATSAAIAATRRDTP